MIIIQRGEILVLKKRNLLFTLLVSLLLFLGACSNQDDNGNDAGDEAESEGGGIVITGDTVTEQGGCVLASRFTVGDKIVFRMNAIDGSTNEQVTDAKLQVHLSTGETLDMEYGPHGDDNFWVVAYPVTEDTPTGTLEYHVTAEAGDRSAEFKPFNVAPSLLTIVDPEELAGGEEAAVEEEEEEEIDLANVETTQNVDIIATDFEFNEDTWYVKAGEEVTVTLENEEGTHGIAIIGLDVALSEPGETVFTPTEAGEYQIVCSVFCGAGHGDMQSKLVVLE